MTEQSNDLSLHPVHLEDLSRSGLKDETIREAGIHSVPPYDISKKLEGRFSKVKSLLVFPYPGCEGFERYKLFPPQQTGKGTVKYYQKSGTPPRLYIPHKVTPILSDTSIPIYFTEGEKKTLKANQEGLFCIGLGGLWNWSDGSEEKNLIPDFDLFTLEGRTVYIVPDNDWLSPDRHGKPKNLREAVYELAYRLIDRGAKVFIVELSQGPEKGVDDFLCRHSIEDFQVLPKKEVRRLTIEEMIEEVTVDSLPKILKKLCKLMESQREPYISKIKEKMGIPKAQLRNDLNRLNYELRDSEPQGTCRKENVDIDRLLESDANIESRYSAQNYIDGVLSFGAMLGKEQALVRSDREIILADGDSGDSFRFNRSTLTAEAIKRFRAGEDVDGRDLLNRIKTLFADHVVFKDSRIPLLLTVWVLGTYLFELFRYFGYLWANSPFKRCGKTLLLDILALISFNATSRLINPSGASIFREVDRNSATLIIDEAESLSYGDKDQRAELISLLNGGFQKGSFASRVETKDKQFVVVNYNSYSPKVLAGIKGVVDTIEDRSFKILMRRKSKKEIVKRFNLKSLKTQIEKIREDCFLWALRYARDISEVYDSVDQFPGTESLDDRLKDILEPLLSIASIVDAQAEDEKTQTVKKLIDLSMEMGRGREEGESLINSIPAVVNLMKNIVDGSDEKFISVDEIFSRFQADEDLGFIESKRGLSFFLKNLDLHRAPSRWIDEKTTRGYILTRKWVEDLKERYA
jgi:hypothetical protein